MLSFKFPFNASKMSKNNSEIESNVKILPNHKSQLQTNKLQVYLQSKVIGERILKT